MREKEIYWSQKPLRYLSNQVFRIPHKASLESENYSTYRENKLRKKSDILWVPAAAGGIKPISLNKTGVLL